MQPVAGATGKRFDELGGRRLQTRLGGAKLCLARAGRICPDLCASRLVRSTATHCDGPLDLEPNPPRQNGSNLRLDALDGARSDKVKQALVKPAILRDNCDRLSLAHKRVFYFVVIRNAEAHS